VKIRGTAAHVAEKYMSLARDALASGDLVGAESYLQHAEHYNRIIMAAQTQFGGQPNAQAGEGPNGGGSYRNSRWNSDDEGDDEGAEAGGGEIRAGGGGQDRERHAGDREHQPGGRDRNRHGGNGHEASREQNGADQPEAVAPDDTAPDPVS
jgi:hypothetical protein